MQLYLKMRSSTTKNQTQGNLEKFPHCKRTNPNRLQRTPKTRLGPKTSKIASRHPRKGISFFTGRSTQPTLFDRLKGKPYLSSNCKLIEFVTIILAYQMFSEKFMFEFLYMKFLAFIYTLQIKWEYIFCYRTFLTVFEFVYRFYLENKVFIVNFTDFGVLLQ